MRVPIEIRCLIRDLSRRRALVTAFFFLVFVGAALTSAKFLLLENLLRAAAQDQVHVGRWFAATIAAWLGVEWITYLTAGVGVRIERRLAMDRLEQVVADLLGPEGARQFWGQSAAALAFLRFTLKAVGRTLRALLGIVSQTTFLFVSLCTAVALQPEMASIVIITSCSSAYFGWKQMARQRRGVHQFQTGTRRLQVGLHRLFAALAHVKIFRISFQSIRPLVRSLHDQKHGERTAMHAQRLTALQTQLAMAAGSLALLAWGVVRFNGDAESLSTISTLLVLQQVVFAGVRQVVSQCALAQENRDLLAKLHASQGRTPAVAERAIPPLVRMRVDSAGASTPPRKVYFEPGRLYGIVDPTRRRAAAWLHALANPWSLPCPIYWNDERLTAECYRSFRQAMMLITRPTYLLDATLAENLRVARPDATDAEILDVLARTGLDGDLKRWTPLEQLALELGRNGLQLSVGQLRRLSLARAILRKPDIVLIDEPISGLSPETQSSVLRALAHLAAHSAVLIVAQDESTLEACHELLILEADGDLTRTSWKKLRRDTERFSHLLGPRCVA